MPPVAYTILHFMQQIPLDIHAHGRQKCGSAVVSGSPAEVMDMIEDGCPGPFSAGIHPWATQNLGVEGMNLELARLERVVELPCVVAVGEVGLDALRGASLALQEFVFRRQVEISEAVGKPLVLHVVRTGHRLMELCKTLQRELPQGIRQPWIWHGFRGSPQQADQFLALREKNYLSFGERFNPAAAAAVNPGRMLVETDEADMPLSRVVDNVADALSTDAFSLSGIIQANLSRIFPAI